MHIPTPSPAPPLGARTVLVLDDNADDLMIAAIALKKLGFSVIAVDTPWRALEILKGPEKPLIFAILTDLDLRNPEMNGFDFAVAARASTFKNRIVIASGCFESAGYAGARDPRLLEVAHGCIEKTSNHGAFTAALSAHLA